MEATDSPDINAATAPSAGQTARADSDDVAMLRPETLAILKQFAREMGRADSDSDDADDNDADAAAAKAKAGDESHDDDEEDALATLAAMQRYFQDPDREDTFDVDYSSPDGSRRVAFQVKGVKRELGQTLNSTGLTIWRAAEHLCAYIASHADRFTGQTVCELGAGLGMVAILLDKFNPDCARIVATDGDDDTMDLLRENLVLTESSVEAHKLYWGDHEAFLAAYPQKFDILLAADVIYEDDQVKPLIASVRELLAPKGEFILAYARRNVPVDKVLAEAEAAGLTFQIIDLATHHHLEPIYSLRWKR